MGQSTELEPSGKEFTVVASWLDTRTSLGALG